MTSDNNFVVFVYCVYIPLPYKHNENSDVLHFAVNFNLSVWIKQVYE